MLNCMGCHLLDGAGAPPAIPRLKDRVGYYLTVEQGRGYLVQVPGAANSLLDDEKLARVLNGIIIEFAGVSLPEHWQPYAADEVGRYRAARPADIDGLRHRLEREVSAAYSAAGAW